MKDKKKLIYIGICILIVLSLTCVIYILFGNKPIKYEDYMYLENIPVNKFKKLKDNKDELNCYYKKATFLKNNGIAYFYLTSDNKLVKNSFTFETDYYNDEKKLDKEIQDFIKDFNNYINYNGSISHTLIPIDDNQINYEESVLQNVINKKAVLNFNIINKTKTYNIYVSHKDDKYSFEVTYNGINDKTNENNKIPSSVNGVG